MGRLASRVSYGGHVTGKRRVPEKRRGVLGIGFDDFTIPVSAFANIERREHGGNGDPDGLNGKPASRTLSVRKSADD